MNKKNERVGRVFMINLSSYRFKSLIYHPAFSKFTFYFVRGKKSSTYLAIQVHKKLIRMQNSNVGFDILYGVRSWKYMCVH